MISYMSLYTDFFMRFKYCNNQLSYIYIDIDKFELVDDYLVNFFWHHLVKLLKQVDNNNIAD